MRAWTTFLLPTVLAVGQTYGQSAGSTRLGGFYLSAFGGGAAHSDLQRTATRAEWQGIGRIESRDFSRRLSPSTSPALGLGVAYWASPWWGVRIQGTLLPTRFEVSVSDRQKAELPTRSPITGEERFAQLWIWSADAQVAVRAPFTPRGRVAPYGFAGLSAVRYAARGPEPVPPEAAGFEQSGRGELGGVIGAGALVPLRRDGLALTFEVADRIVRTPIRRPATATVEANGVLMRTDATREPSGGGQVRLLNHVQILIGLSLSLK